IYPELDPRPERELVERLETAVFGDGDVDPPTAVLVAVASHAGLLKASFGKRLSKDRRDRIERISDGAHTGKATKDAIAAAQAAVLAAAMVPGMVTGGS